MGKKDKESSLKKVIIDDKKGISISYDREDIKKILPHLFNELKKSSQKIRINGITDSNEIIEKSDELFNPRAEDFIRRCSTQKEAYDILDFLLKREEISEKEYNTLKKRIKNEGIESFGEEKTWGYYERKYSDRR